MIFTALKQLEKNENGFVCPQCHQNLRFVDGGAVRIVDGKLDMDNAKVKYECYTCGVYYREVMNTGYYDVFPLDKQSEGSRLPEEQSQGEGQIARTKMFCPQCGKLMVPRFDGEPAADDTGKQDSVEAAYQCEDCDISYQESVVSGTRHTLTWHTGSIFGKSSLQLDSAKAALSSVVSAAEESPALAQAGGQQAPPAQTADTGKRELKATGDLPPMELKKDERGRCDCPRCGGSMKYIEGQPVRIVDGKLTFDDVLGHFSCPDCNSVFRRIAGTDFFQYSEK